MCHSTSFYDYVKELESDPEFKELLDEARACFHYISGDITGIEWVLYRGNTVNLSGRK